MTTIFKLVSSFEESQKYTSSHSDGHRNYDKDNWLKSLRHTIWKNTAHQLNVL